jgi:hypothetical protein
MVDTSLALDNRDHRERHKARHSKPDGSHLLTLVSSVAVMVAVKIAGKPLTAPGGKDQSPPIGAEASKALVSLAPGNPARSKRITVRQIQFGIRSKIAVCSKRPPHPKKNARLVQSLCSTAASGFVNDKAPTPHSNASRVGSGRHVVANACQAPSAAAPMVSKAIAAAMARCGVTNTADVFALVAAPMAASKPAKAGMVASRGNAGQTGSNPACVAAKAAAPMAASKPAKAGMVASRGNAGRIAVKAACHVAVAVAIPTAAVAAPTAAAKASQVSISTSVAARKSAAVTTTAIAVVAAITAIAVVAASTGTVAAVATTTEDEGGSHLAHSSVDRLRGMGLTNTHPVLPGGVLSKGCPARLYTKLHRAPTTS